MKNPTTSRAGALAFLVAGLGVATSLSSRAQTPVSPVSPLQIAGLEQVGPETILTNGMYYWLLSEALPTGPGAPYPYNPFPDQPAYLVPNSPGILVDDSAVDYGALAQQLMVDSGLRTLEGRYGLTTLLDGAPAPPGGGDGGGDGGSWGGPLDYHSYPSNSLWLEIVNATNGFANLVIHGTVQDVSYEILSTPTLTNIVWASEGSVIGVADQNWTPVAVWMGTRTNSLFFRARSWIDSTGGGIADWWFQQYFGPSNWPDPYSMEPSGDGWTILQAYQNGWNPFRFHTPPPPRNVAARLDSTGTNVVITWESGGGPVSNYVVEDDYLTSEGQVGSSTFNLTFNPHYDYVGSLYPERSFAVLANFTNGSSARSGFVTVSKPWLDRTVDIVRGPLGQAFLAVTAPPPDLFRVLVYWQESGGTTLYTNVYATNLVNGIAPVTAAAADAVGFWSQLFSTNASFGAPTGRWLAFPNDYYSERLPWYNGAYAFVDARSHLKENLRFLLRSASLDLPFSYTSDLKTDGTSLSAVLDADWSTPRPESYYARGPASTNYEYVGFHVFSPNLNYSFMEELRPLRDHYLWRNFVFDPLVYQTNGAGFYDYAGDPIRTLEGAVHRYTGNGTESPVALAFSVTNSTWLYSCWTDGLADDPYANPENGITIDNTGRLILGSMVRNCFGLSIDSVRVDEGDIGSAAPTLWPGVPTALYRYGVHYYTATAVPALQTVGYYFVSQTPFLKYNFYYGTPRPPIPGSPDFTVTNTSPLLITGVGQPITVSGWAKMAITNGFAGKYGYLEQYFDSAYKINADGTVSTNQTGILSPYGEFFPTESGPIALWTMPDVETGDRGTGVVNVIKLQTDVDHNLQMDLSFAGPDNTSQARPQIMWVNSDCDAAGLYGDPDRDINWPQRPDYNYSDPAYGNGKPCIHSQRDLEDYARLWICGVPALANGNYQVSLSWGSISSGNPVIHLFQAVETNGGALYLSDTNVAAAQAAIQTIVVTTNGAYAIPGPGVSIGTVTNGRTLTFPANYFTNSATKYLIFEGAGIGVGQLTMTISQTTAQVSNVLAQTSMWLDLRDPKNMYEQVHISGVTNAVPPLGFLSSSYQQLNRVDAGSDEDTNIIVFVHGWRMGVWDYENFSESMFKRLYWQGYRGRFISIRWDTLSKDDFKFASTLQSFLTYNASEYRAWESAKGLSDYLTYLKQQRFPNYNLNVCSHSMGGVVVAEALKLQLAAGQHDVNNYVLMQAAVPASCYDTSFTNYAPLIQAEQQKGPTPNTYLGYPGAIGGAVSGHLVDFYNTNDFALATGTLPVIGAVSWEANQKNYKPDSGFGYTTDGTNCFNFRQGYRTVTDSQEIMSFCARPRSKAVGAQQGAGGAITGGSIDLKASYGFDLDKSEHSAEFNRNIQQLSGFYRQLGIGLGVFQPSTP